MKVMKDVREKNDTLKNGYRVRLSKDIFHFL